MQLQIGSTPEASGNAGTAANWPAVKVATVSGSGTAPETDSFLLRFRKATATWYGSAVETRMPQ